MEPKKATRRKRLWQINVDKDPDGGFRTQARFSGGFRVFGFALWGLVIMFSAMGEIPWYRLLPLLRQLLNALLAPGDPPIP